MDCGGKEWQRGVSYIPPILRWPKMPIKEIHGKKASTIKYIFWPYPGEDSDCGSVWCELREFFCHIIRPSFLYVLVTNRLYLAGCLYLKGLVIVLTQGNRPCPSYGRAFCHNLLLLTAFGLFLWYQNPHQPSKRIEWIFFFFNTKLICKFFKHVYDIRFATLKETYVLIVGKLISII